MNQIKVKFNGFLCLLEKWEYQNGRVALELTDIKNGEPVLMATVNIPEEVLEANQVVIKNYSENEGIMEVLINAEVISTPIRFANNNPEMPVCRLLI